MDFRNTAGQPWQQAFFLKQAPNINPTPGFDSGNGIGKKIDGDFVFFSTKGTSNPQTE
jgi:hypothetical protein